MGLKHSIAPPGGEHVRLFGPEAVTHLIPPAPFAVGWHSQSNLPRALPGKFSLVSRAEDPFLPTAVFLVVTLPLAKGPGTY